jgi:Ca2+-binding RTX toxin-like protein
MFPQQFVLGSIEALEPRRLLTAALTNGILTITGTSKADLLIVTEDSANVFVSLNGATSTPFDASQIKSLSIDLAGGNDRTFMQDKGKLPLRIPALIMGSKGNDTLRGGLKNDTLLGGSGDDVLDGGAGADLMVGGDGFDTADYSSRVNSVTVNFDNLANDGETNEDDNVQTDAVIGGSGNDDFIIDPQDTGHDIHGGPGTDIVDYGLLAVQPQDFNTISLDDVQNDGVNGLDNIHSDVEDIYGSNFADSIVGDAADNVILGNGGDDELHGGDGNDTLSGGAGQDTMFGDAGDDFFINGNASTPSDPDNDEIHGGTGENFDQADPFDFVVNQPGDQTQNDFDSVDRSGNSQPLSAKLQFAPKAAPAVKTLGVASLLTITGTSKADKIVINQNDTVISYVLNGVATTVPSSTVSSIAVDCQGGNDTVVMSKGDGTNAVRVPTSVSGGNGNDQLKGGLNNDTLGGGNGNDLLVGNDGNDSLVGGLGSDNLIGGNGDDFMVGDTSSSDTLGFGADNFEGDAGVDTADYSTRTDNLSITMDDDLPNDGGNGGAEGDNIHSDVENVFGGSGNDSIVGNASANFLAGGPGNDSLRGGTGLDKLVGGDGLDTLKGGADLNLFFISDGVKDKFDALLDGAGRPIGDFVNGDSDVDLSIVSNTALGVAS